MHPAVTTEQKNAAFHELQLIKATFAAKGWFPATSGNLSLRIGDMDHQRADASGNTYPAFTFAITASGKDKSHSTPDDFLLVNEQSLPIESTHLKPSAETKIHSELYRLTGCRAIFHVHTVYNCLLSEIFWEQGSILIEGVEIIKAFHIWDEDASIRIPILPNYANIERIAEMIAHTIQPRIPGIVLCKHGIYAWGDSVFEAKKHLEAFEFLFEYAYKMLLTQTIRHKNPDNPLSSL